MDLSSLKLLIFSFECLLTKSRGDARWVCEEINVQYLQTSTHVTVLNSVYWTKKYCSIKFIFKKIDSSAIQLCYADISTFVNGGRRTCEAFPLYVVFLGFIFATNMNYICDKFDNICSEYKLHQTSVTNTIFHKTIFNKYFCVFKSILNWFKYVFFGSTSIQK